MTATAEQMDTIHDALYTAIGEIIFTSGAQSDFIRRSRGKDLKETLEVFLDITDEDIVPEGEFYHKDTDTKDFIETVHSHRYNSITDDQMAFDMTHTASAYVARFDN